MTIAFWLLFGLVLYAYIGYPLLIGLVAILRGRRPDRDDAFEPTVSILIPAYNEEAIIGAKLDNVLSLDYPASKREIIVASESDDGTNEIVERYAGRGVRLLRSETRRGKVANLYRAVPHATGEILVFTDANAMLRRDALRKLMRNFADPRVGSVSGRLVYVNPAGATSGAGESVYWGFEMLIKRASSALGSLPGANGSLFALRRHLYRPINERRGDDFELPIRVILQGWDSILEPEAVSEEIASSGYVEEYRRKLRIINWMVVSAVILVREAVVRGCLLLSFQLLSHKLSRWAVPFWLVALLPLSLLLASRGGFYLVAAASQLLVYGLALIGWGAAALRARLPSLFMLPFYFVVVNLACLGGVLTALAGREVIWHKRSDTPG
ncbi:MAG: glycosyltransferase family 2 protein [Acidobacteriota bacterium]